jgi:hypothetical protein
MNYFAALYRLGQDPLEQEWMSWQLPSSASPFISPEEIEAARRSLPERVFAQEYLAQFLELEAAAVFRGVQAVARLQPQRPERGHQYVFGVDWARRQDFTTISILDSTLMQQVALDRFNQIDYEFQCERLHAWAKLYQPIVIQAEANAMGIPLIERLVQGYRLIDGTMRPPLPVYPWTATNATKANQVQLLSAAIERGELTLLADDVQTAELLSFESQLLPSGLLRYAAPEGGHDDTVISLMLAYSAAQREPSVQRSSYAFASRR